MVSCAVTKSFRGLWCGLPGANLLSADRPIGRACHCGAVTFELASRPKWMVSCNCSVCRSLGALWVHAPPAVATIDAPPNSTKTYMWGDRGIEFHSCATCGCTTHWLGVSGGRVAVNMRRPIPRRSGACASVIGTEQTAGTGWTDLDFRPMFACPMRAGDTWLSKIVRGLGQPRPPDRVDFRYFSTGTRSLSQIRTQFLTID